MLEPPTAQCPSDGAWHPNCAYGLSEIVECELLGELQKEVCTLILSHRTHTYICVIYMECIYTLGHITCASNGSRRHSERYNGYQYSMEWYFMEMLRENRQYLAESFEEAEFVYFAHCVSQLYFALRESYNLSHWQAIERAELGYLVPILRWAHRSPAHRKHEGRNFWTVFSMDLGRRFPIEDFRHLYLFKFHRTSYTYIRLFVLRVASLR